MTPIQLQFRNYKVVYRRYAGLFFCVCVDANDNELAYLEAIHFFVEVLGERGFIPFLLPLIRSTDTFFDNVCELDLVFNFYKVHLPLSFLFCSQCCLRCTLFWMRFSWQGRSRRRARMSSSRGWKNWRSWSSRQLYSMLYPPRHFHPLTKCFVSSQNRYSFFDIGLLIPQLCFYSLTSGGDKRAVVPGYRGSASQLKNLEDVGGVLGRPGTTSDLSGWRVHTCK